MKRSTISPSKYLSLTFLKAIVRDNYTSYNSSTKETKDYDKEGVDDLILQKEQALVDKELKELEERYDKAPDNDKEE